ncbi:putative trans-acting enoyl reductase [Amylocarpus encephaloides]|uniref:Trans-acting enoyl reductase n=1 Tax=Amylocarpus encephaloides TaxID=45428 RepID=A0A9P7YQ41_9HELO|nr:putative trans-acting enoyl reductase [Amylocarpus encephaloides]
MTQSREYDIVVLGATGYTGKLAAECIARKAPSNIRWAIAGCSKFKLEEVALRCKLLKPDRIQPAIEICSLDPLELDSLAKKATVLITTIGPYSVYGEAPFKACAENGTHYLDITGEAVWHNRMIKKYETTARSTGSIMIPQIGLQSAPADLIAWTLVTLIREKFSVPTAEVVMWTKFIGRPSGGTTSTLLGIFDFYSKKELFSTIFPFARSPIASPKRADCVSWTTKLFGVRTIPGLGVMTSYIFAATDKSVVYRTWGLHGSSRNYGPSFEFNEYKKAKNCLSAVVFHFWLAVGVILVAIPFIRSLLRKLAFQPGYGPPISDTRGQRMEFRAIANQDVKTPNPARVLCKATYIGSPYDLTALLITTAAVSILRDWPRLEGGVYTPACLGETYIDRLYDNGFQIRKKVMLEERCSSLRVNAH